MTILSEENWVNALNIITEQIKQLINIFLVKNIVTGDRVLDGTVCIIFNTLFSLFGQIIYKFILEKYNTYKNINKVETDSPTDINHEQFNYDDYKMEDIIKYKFVNNEYEIYRLCISWIKKNYKTYNTNKQIFTVYSSNQTNIAENSLKNIIMPIWKYKNINTNKYDYIWFVNETIYSNNFNELLKLLNDIYKSPSTNKINSNICVNILSIKHGSIFINNLGAINSTCVFENIHFDKKPQLLSVLDKFKENSMYPEGLAISNKLGILLYGPPGTGKTGCISAIANYLDREIFMIDELNYENYKCIFDYLYSIQKKINKYVIVFDEIDYILCSDNEKINLNLENQLTELKEKLLYTENKEERTNITNKIKLLKENNNNNFIKAILNFLDGVSDMSGRIIIATTNNPEKINPLFLRPGRFDLKLKLGYCSKQMFIDIIEKKFPNFMTENKQNINIDQLLEKNITPLVLINSMLKSNTFDELIGLLNELPYTEGKIYQ